MSERDDRRLGVALDTASDIAGVALTEDGDLLAEVSWRTHRNHSRELLPAFDWLLSRHGRRKEEIAAIFVCTGPGSYAGLRVGVSTAKALAYALDTPIVGIGRLAADALPLVGAARGRIIAVHAAGRAELAWAAYQRDGEDVLEVGGPRLGPADELVAAVRPDDVVCADLNSLGASLIEALSKAGAAVVETAGPRVAAVSRLGWRRLVAGLVDNPDTLVPLYLRAPAIGPQR